MYLLTGGPLWRHLRENDFVRIVASYAVIPLAVAIALHRNGALRLTWLARGQRGDRGAEAARDGGGGAVLGIAAVG